MNFVAGILVKLFTPVAIGAIAAAAAVSVTTLGIDPATGFLGAAATTSGLFALTDLFRTNLTLGSAKKEEDSAVKDDRIENGQNVANGMFLSLAMAGAYVVGLVLLQTAPAEQGFFENLLSFDRA